MEWFIDLYDNFRMRRMLYRISEGRTEKDVDFITDVLRLSREARILDLFCGTGRHTLELSRRGYESTGIDINEENIKIAEKQAEIEGLIPNFIQGDVRNIDFGNDYNAVIVMYNSFGYFSDRENVMVLKKVFNSLKEQGRFLIEILNKDWLLLNFKEKEEIEFNGVKIIEEREFDRVTNRNNFTITRYKKGEVTVKKGSWRFYSLDEMKEILTYIGFGYLDGYSNLKKEPVRNDTRLMRLIFEK